MKDGRIFYIEMEGYDEKPEIKITGTEDFLPIVTINDKEEAYNAIYFIEECNKIRTEILDLGNNYDSDLKKYIVPQIVISKNLKSYIPLKNIQGYDGWGFDDGDGVLEFKSSNSNVSIRILDEDTPEKCKDETKKYNLNDAEIGDKYTLEISCPSLKRGDKFHIEVWASDDDDWGGKSNKKILCGKLNFTIIQSDVFLKNEIDPMKDFLKNNASLLNFSRKDCITTLNTALKKLYKTEKLSVGTQIKTGGNREGTMEKLDNQGKVKSSFTIEYEDTKGKVCSKGTPYKANKMKDSLSSKINELVGNNIGFHVFGVSIADGYHSMLLTVDNTNPCKKKYILSDQVPTYTEGWKEYENGEKLDAWITKLTVEYHSKRDIYSGTTIWKLKR